VDFWFDHFNVDAGDGIPNWSANSYEREAIRRHVLGRFEDLLVATARHPAMLDYLDNAQSVVEGFRPPPAAPLPPGAQAPTGLNENYARELLELHTLGVDGGYTQGDVTELAKILTGWSIGGALREGGGRLLARFAGDPGKPGEFHFREGMHEPGSKTLLGETYRERGREEGEEALRALARHPATARHLATKLARHFVADEPPAALVERLAATYLDGDGDLTRVYRTLVESAESWREPLAKFKTPQDFAISAYRSLDYAPANLQPLTAFLTQVGQRPYTPGSPAGFADTAASWNGGDALLKRIEFATAAGRAVGDRVDPLARASEVLGALGEHTTLAIRNAESGAQGFALLLASPEFQRR
jgi:uncharacterized protein (DUF1800 family)